MQADFLIAQTALESSAVNAHIFTLVQETRSQKIYILRWIPIWDSNPTRTSIYVLTYGGFCMKNIKIDTYLYVRVDGWKVIDTETKKAPAEGRRREHGLGRRLQGQEGRVR